VSAARRVGAELIGTTLLLAIVVGSGIMGERLARGNDALALLANSIATGAGLIVLITTLAPVSGAHFNPVVSLAETLGRRLSAPIAAGYLAAQLAGAVAGVAAAHLMFDEPLFALAEKSRAGLGQLWSETVATFGLLLTILGARRQPPAVTATLVGAYIAAAYWFTASTSFANPAVTVARSLTNTFTGIRPADVPGFVLAQLAGGALAVAAARWLFRDRSDTS
jgi:glycerol uptake facilitator-like aquaporin